MKYYREGGGFDKKEPYSDPEDNSGEDLISRY